MSKRSWPARVLTIAYVCATVVLIAIVADSYNAGPRRLTVVLTSRFAVEVNCGQLRFSRARILLARATGTRDGNATFALAQEPWDRPLDAGLPRVTLDSWPPLWNNASMFVGGNVASYVGAADGKMTYDFLESGLHVDVWSMSAWLAVGLFALPLVPLARRTLRNSVRPGHCLACGYDLRASPGRCPECGRVASTTAAAS